MPRCGRAAAAWLWLVAALAGGQVASAVSGETAPVAVWRSDGVLVLRQLPAFLGQPDVRQHLESGLTTSLVIVFEGHGADGSERRGGARVDVRFEPWDEVFHITVAAADGTIRPVSRRSFADLTAWWSELELAVLAPTPRPAIVRLDVELTVLPFSHDEERDARRWFTNSLGRANDGGATGASPQADRTLDLLVATSIRRRSVLTYRWQLDLDPVPPAARP